MDATMLGVYLGLERRSHESVLAGGGRQVLDTHAARVRDGNYLAEIVCSNLMAQVDPISQSRLLPFQQVVSQYQTRQVQPNHRTCAPLPSPRRTTLLCHVPSAG